MKPDKLIIGRREWFSIPELNLGPLRGKIDTGARSSCLHAIDIEGFEKDGEPWVRFKSVDDISCESPVIYTKKVKSSNGLPTERYFIEVVAFTLAGRKVDLVLSLASRAAMKNPLLLGRRALAQFLVDSTRTQLFGKPSEDEE